MFRVSALPALMLISMSFFALNIHATPNWLPKVSCREAWRQKDLAQYDFAKDSRFGPLDNSSYRSYQARLQKNGVDRQTCYKDWTVLVYMSAPEDLQPYALWDLEEMEGKFESGRYAGSTLKTDLIVQADLAKTSDASLQDRRRLHIFQRDDRTYSPAISKSKYVKRGLEIIRSPTIEVLKPARPSGEDLKQFLEWGIKAYPAKSYMVILWGHGQGWSSSNNQVPVVSNWSLTDLTQTLTALQQIPQPPPRASFGGMFANPSTGSYVSIPELRDALRDVVGLTLNGSPIDVYASDACLMQMAEVVGEISPFTRYVSGSAQVQSYLGLPYRRLLYEINSGRFLSSAKLTGKDDEARLVAMMLPRLSEASLDPKRGQQGRADAKARESYTMSSISSSAFEQRFLPKLKAFSAAMSAYLSEDPIRALKLESLIRSTPSFMGGGREIGSFLKLIELFRREDLQREPETSGSSRLELELYEMQHALDETVIERRMGTGYTIRGQAVHLLGFRGLGIWIPIGNEEFQHRKNDFQQSRVHSQSGWQSWLAMTFSP